jgi:ATP-binding cassette subfamily C protein CydC
MTLLCKLLRLFRPHWGWAALGLLLSVATSLAQLGLMAVAGWFIASMALAGMAGTSINYFTPAAIIRACAIVRTAGRYLERLITHEATLRFLSDLRIWFYQRLEPLAPAQLQYVRSGDLLGRLRADIDALDNLYLGVILPLAAALLVSTVLILVLMSFDSVLALVTAFLLFTAGGVLPWLAWRRGKTAGERLNEHQAALRAGLVDLVQGMDELLVYDAGESQLRRLNQVNRDIADTQEALGRSAATGRTAVGLCASLGLWFTVLLGIGLLSAERLEAADLPMLALLVIAGFEAVTPLPDAFHRLGQTLDAARRVFNLVESKPAVSEPAKAAPLPQDSGIEFHAVRFRYPKQGNWSLRDISFRIAPGERLGVVGATGSGKTSLLNLLLRFWEPDAGTIRLGGEDVRQLAGDDIRRRIAVVSQHGHLFNASIRDNLLLGNAAASNAEIYAAAEAAHIHDFVTSLPEGYDTWLGETGVPLSGGQARRMLIARALLKDAPVLLLDEPTEGLDTCTERDLMRTLLDTTRGRTMILVTHRLVGLEEMDGIVVLDDGHIVQQGTHRELMGSDGCYRDFHDLLVDPQ